MTFVLAACKGNGDLAPSPGLPFAGLRPAQAPIEPAHNSKIQHVVIVIQENRTLNNLFYGFPGARTAKYGYNLANHKIELKPVTLATTWDLQHNGRGFIISCNGKGKIPGTDCRMNGFDREKWGCGDGGPSCPNKNPPYSYVPQHEVQPYFDMAKQYVLADEMFASDFDISSFISHQYIIAAQNPDSAVDYPSEGWGCPGAAGDSINKLGPNRKILLDKLVPCWNPKTLADELDAAGISWAYYAQPVTSEGGKNCGDGAKDDSRKSGISGDWSAFQAVEHICYGTDWDNDVVSPPAQFLRDVKSGNLRAVTWVTPTYNNSDHGGSGSKTGPSWVASLVNAVGESQFWKSSAIFIFWDDPGGWYDPVAPAYVDNDGLGYRLPLLIISPYARQGYVSHVHYEHGTILKFVENIFGLPRLAASDKRANPPDDAFDFSQPPRTFVRIHAPHDEDYFLHQPLDTRPVDTD
jgi:phospholipase C